VNQCKYRHKIQGYQLKPTKPNKFGFISEGLEDIANKNSKTAVFDYPDIFRWPFLQPTWQINRGKSSDSVSRLHYFVGLLLDCIRLIILLFATKQHKNNREHEN